MMTEWVIRHWWTFVLRGVLAILFGIVAVVWPSLTVATLIIIFGAYLLVDGVFSVGAAFINGGNGRWVQYLLIGVIDIIIGLATLIWPGVTALGLIWFIGIWAVILGLLQIFGSFRLRQSLGNEIWSLLSGILAVLVGLYLIVFPGSGAVSLVWVIGIYAIVFGVMLIVLGFQLRGRSGAAGSGTGNPAPVP